MSENIIPAADGHDLKHPPHFDSAEYTEFLLQCMVERLEIARALQSLGRSQADAVDGADINATLRILARKQSLLEQLRILGQRLQPYFQDDPEARIWESPDRRHVCQQIADEGSRLLCEATQVDACLLDDMAQRRDALAAQLQDGTDSILAHSAYTAGNGLGISSLDICDA